MKRSYCVTVCMSRTVFIDVDDADDDLSVREKSREEILPDIRYMEGNGWEEYEFESVPDLVPIEETYELILSIVKLRFPLYSETSRVSQDMWCRLIIYKFLIDRGYGMNAIAKVMKKNHSTVFYYRDKLESLVRYDKEFRDFTRKFPEVEFNLK